MSENDRSENDELFPELVHLPVYREDYISQQRVDELCELLWTDKAEPILKIARDEKYQFFPDECRNAPFAKEMSRMTFHLRELEKEGKIEEISMIAMVDLVYEIVLVLIVGGVARGGLLYLGLASQKQHDNKSHGL